MQAVLNVQKVEPPDLTKGAVVHAPREIRIAALKRVPALVIALKEAATRAIAEIDEAAASTVSKQNITYPVSNLRDGNPARKVASRDWWPRRSPALALRLPKRPHVSRHSSERRRARIRGL